jgi:hypothetical protein
MFVLAVIIIMLVGFISAGVGAVDVKGLASNFDSTGGSNNLVCLDSDAMAEVYYVGYVDGMNDFHQIKHDQLTGTLNATERV